MMMLDDFLVIADFGADFSQNFELHIRPFVGNGVEKLIQHPDPLFSVGQANIVEIPAIQVQLPGEFVGKQGMLTPSL